MRNGPVVTGRRNEAWLVFVLGLFLLPPFAVVAFSKTSPVQEAPAAQEPVQSADSYGASQSVAEAAQIRRLPRTKVSVMPYRHLALQFALEGYLRTKVPLVAFDGTNYLAAGFSDDPGIYYFIPRVKAWTGLSLEQSMDLFWGTILLVCFLAGIIGFLVILDSGPLKVWAVFGLCTLFWFAFKKGDVYVALSAPAVAIVPWFVYLLRKRASVAATAAFLFGAGLVAGGANQIRSYAAVGLLLFIVILVAWDITRPWAHRLALLAVLLLGVAIPAASFRSMIAERDVYLSAAAPGYSKTVKQHPIWHTVYVGLGFTKNPYVAGYDDEVAANAVRAISPTTPYLSLEYERILRDESLRIAREHPFFVLFTLAAKLRVILFLLLCWANAGLLAAALYPKGWAMELGFWAALAFTSLFGFVALPEVQYMLGFMAFATLYGLISLDWALRQRRTQAHRPN